MLNFKPKSRKDEYSVVSFELFLAEASAHFQEQLLQLLLQKKKKLLFVGCVGSGARRSCPVTWARITRGRRS